jgi:phage replication O-like protein O
MASRPGAYSFTVHARQPWRGAFYAVGRNMSGPQIENGYTKIANEVLDALMRTRIPGEARQVLDAIIRKTYGFNKKSDTISLSQFEEMTGLKRPHICRSINKLIAMNLITKKDNENSASYCFNKIYATWQPLPKKITLSKKIIPVTKKDNRVVPKKVHTKETLTKDNTAKEKKKRTFSRPSVEDVRKYVKDNGYDVDAQHFIDHYDSNGWKVGKNSMKDWQAAVRTWHRRNEEKNGAPKGTASLEESLKKHQQKHKSLTAALEKAPEKDHRAIEDAIYIEYKAIEDIQDRLNLPPSKRG